MIDGPTAAGRLVASIGSGSEKFYVYIDPTLSPTLGTNGTSCFRGRWRHTKGLTRSEIEARGSEMGITHAPNPNYILAP